MVQKIDSKDTEHDALLILCKVVLTQVVNPNFRIVVDSLMAPVFLSILGHLELDICGCWQNGIVVVRHLVADDLIAVYNFSLEYNLIHRCSCIRSPNTPHWPETVHVLEIPACNLNINADLIEVSITQRNLDLIK